MTNNENDIQQPSIEEIKRNAANKAASNITSSKTMPIKKGENNRSIEDIKREAAINASDDTINKKKSGTEDSIVPSKDGVHNLSEALNGKYDGDALPFYTHQDKKIKTTGGMEFNANAIPYSNDEKSLNELQKRVTEGNPTQDDIEHLSKASGKSPNVVEAYIKKGNEAGVLTENIDKRGKVKKDLTETVQNYNKHFGTDFKADDVLGSAEKASQFLDALRSGEKSKMALDAKFKAGFKGYEQELRNLPEHDLLPAQEFLAKSKEYKNLLTEHVVDLTRKEDEKNGVSKNETLNKISKRIDPKNYNLVSEAIADKYTSSFTGNSVFDGISAMGKMYDELSGSDKEETLNSIKGIADVAYNKSKKQSGLDKMSQAYTTGDKTLYEQGKIEYNQADEDVIYNYPALIKKKIADTVNKKILEEQGLSEGSDVGSLREKLLGASKSDYVRVMKENGFFDDPRTKDYAEQFKNDTSLFANSSLLGSTVRSFTDMFKELGLSVGDITGFRTKTDQITDKIKEEQFPKELPLGEDVSNWFEVPKIALNMAGSIAGMAAIQAATAGLGTEIGMGEKAATKLGTYASLGNYDSHLKDSYDNESITTDAGRHIYAALGMAVNGEIGKFLELDHYINLPNSVKKTFGKVAEGLSNKTMSNELANELINGNKKDLLKFTKNYAVNVGSGALTTASFGVANNVLKLLAGDKEMSVDKIVTDARKSLVDGLIGMTLIGGVKTLQEHTEAKNSSYKAFTYDLAINHDSWSDVFRYNLFQGADTQEGYNQKMKVLNTAKAAKRALDLGIEQNDLKLDQKQKSVWVANKVAVGALKSQLESAENEISKKEIEAKINALNEQNKNIESGLKFNDVLEPLNDLYQANKDVNEAIKEHQLGNISQEELDSKKDKFKKLYNDYLIKGNRKSEEITDTTTEKDSRQKSEGDKPEADKEATTQNLIPTIKVGENEYSGKNHGEAMEKAREDLKKQGKTEEEINKIVPSPDTEEGKIWRRDNAMFKDMRSENKDLLTRDEAGKKYGIRNSEQLSDNKKSEQETKPIEQPTVSSGVGGDVPESMQPLLKGIDKYKTAKDFEDAHTQSDLLDLSNPQQHRFGRIFSDTGEGYQDVVDINNAYGKGKNNSLNDYKEANVPRTNNPEETVTIYRSAHTGSKGIEAGDYVSFNENYAKSHDRGKLLKLEVPAKDVIWQGNDFNEWIYSPKEIRDKYSDLQDFYNKNKAVEQSLPTQEIKTITPNIEQDISSQKPNTDGKDEKSGEETDAAKKEGEENDVNNKGDETTPPLPPVVDEVENFEKNIPENIVGIKNSIVDESRIHRGLMPLVKAAKRKLGKIWNDLRKDIANGDANPNKLVDDTFTKIINYKSDKDRVIFNTYQNAQLLFHRLDVTNRIKTSEDILQGIENLPSDAKIEDIAKMFEDKADWMFKNDADKAKFKELLSDKEVDAELVKKALGDVINDFHFDLQKNDKIAESIGNEWGVSGAFRGLLVNLQGEVVNWTKQLERQMGEHSDPETLKTISGLEQEYKETIEKLKTAHTEELQKAAEDAYKKAQDLFRKEAEKNKSQSIATKAKTLKQSGKEAADNIRKFKIKTDPNTLQLSILGLPIAVYNTLVDVVSGIVEGGATIAQAIEQVLKDDRFKSVKRNDLINHLTGKISFEGNRENILKDLKEHSIDNKETAITKDNVKKVKNLMSLHIQNGTESLDDLLKKTKDDIKEILPDASEDDIRDALSGRGVKQDTIQKAQTELQRIKQQAVNVGKYVDLLKAPENETESERLKRVKKLNELYEGKDGSGIKAEIEKMGIVPPNDQLRLKDINDKRINNIKVGVKNIVDNIKSSLTKGVKNDAEKSILNDEKSRLNGKLKDLETGKFSQDQRFAQANNIISDQILNHERDRQKLTNIFRKDKPKVGTPEYEAEKEKIDAYTDRIKQLKKIKNDLDVDNKLVSKDVDNQIVAAKLQDALNRSISKMQNSIDNNEFEETEPSKKMGLESIISQPDFAKTKQIRDLERQRNLIELKKRDAIDKYNKSKRGIAAKIADGVVKSKRMFVLVKGAILAKLAAAVMWGQTVFAPLNTLAGAVWNKVGDFASGTLGAKEDIRDNTTWGRFLDKSLRYGRVSAQSELQAYGKAWSWDNFKNKKGFLGLGITNETAKKLDGFKNESTLKSFVSDLNNNYNELSLLFGKDVAPSEYYATVTDEVKFFQKDFWNTVGSGLDFGKGKDVAKGALRVGGKAAETVWQAGEYGIRAHGAIKSVAKGMEFARSYFTIKENARRLNGEAWVNDPVNQMSMGMIAYQEAVRGILMEDNIVTGAYQRMLKSFKKGEGLGSQAAYLTAGELMPVVKVPTNIALQAGRATLGLPLSGGEILARLISEKLSGTNIAKITGTGEFFKRNGTEVVSNEHASALLRNLRNGTVGAAMIMGMALGSMAASNYYFKHKKGSIEEDYGTDKLEEGEVRIGNVTIARDLADNPYFVGAKMAETAWKAFNYYHEGQADPDGYLLSMAKALGVTAAGVIKESPISSTPTTLMAGLEGQQNMGWFWRGLVVSSTYPSMMREMAMYTDKEDGNLIPFKGKTTKRLSPTLMDTYKAWTPILRETLQKK